MTAEADQIGPARVSLPGIPAFLRSVYELGRRSVRPGLPALAFLFLYRLGMGAYGALTNYSEALKGHYVGGKVVADATPILLLALIYIPFLPLQESILRGRPIHFVGAIRRVLRVSLNLILSGIVQVIIILGPITPIAYVGALLLPDPFGPLLWAGMAWMAVAAFFMVFVTPAVVLDGEGPLHSLRTSFHLVSRNFGSALGRLLVLALLAFLGFAVSSPRSTLGPATVPIKLAVVTWTTAAETLLYPFWVAAVMVLYRSLRPWTDDGGAVDANKGVPMLNTKAALLGALVGAGILLFVAVQNPGWVEWLNSKVIKPPVCTMRATGSPVLSFSPVTGLTVQVNGTVLPSRSLKISPISKPIVTIANSTSAAITVTSVALYESFDNTFRPEVDLAPPCKHMTITSDDCVTATGPGTVAPGATCTIKLSVLVAQSGYLLVDTSLGVLTIPIVARL